jgi:hypothetical protein
LQDLQLTGLFGNCLDPLRQILEKLDGCYASRRVTEHILMASERMPVTQRIFLSCPASALLRHPRDKRLYIHGNAKLYPLLACLIAGYSGPHSLAPG